MTYIKVARALRDNSTEAERKFWSRVRAYRLKGLKFRRQQPFGPYIVDFVCFEAEIVVELDGGQHFNCEEDRDRDAWLKTQGLRVLRFWNNEVLKNPDGVIATLLMAIDGSTEDRR
jgi:very-short-patch-repair endonuclease